MSFTVSRLRRMQGHYFTRSHKTHQYYWHQLKTFNETLEFQFIIFILIFDCEIFENYLLCISSFKNQRRKQLIKSYIVLYIYTKD